MNKSSVFILGLLLGLLLSVVSLAMSEDTEPEVMMVERGYKVGNIPYNVPVWAVYKNIDGSLSAYSALRTDYAGLIAFSIDGIQQLVIFDEPDCWVEMNAGILEVLR